MSDISRFLVIEEAQRGPGCSPGTPTAPRKACIDLASLIGAALALPSEAQTIALEECDPDAFVLWHGSSWQCFMQCTQQWSDTQRSNRFHRLGLLNHDRGEVRELLEEFQPAFALPMESWLGLAPPHIFGRKDIVPLLGLDTSPIFETEHYRVVCSTPELTIPELIAVYLRKYWEVLGQ